MSERVKGFVFEIEVDSKTGEAKLRQFQGAAREAMSETKDATATGAAGFAGLRGSMLAFGAGFAAVLGGLQALSSALRGVTDLMGEAIEAAAGQETAERRLVSALVARGLAGDAVIRSLALEADLLQKQIGLADDAALQYQALAIQMGAPVEEASRFVEVAQDIAVVFDRDINRVMRTLSQVAAGTATDLKALGIDMDATELRGKSLGQMLGILETKFGGAAQAQMETFAGRVSMVKLAYGDLLEAVGDIVVRSPSVNLALEAASDILFGLKGSISGNTDVLKPFVQLTVDGAIVVAQLGVGAEEAANALARLGANAAKVGVPLKFFFDNFTPLGKTIAHVQNLADLISSMQGGLDDAGSTGSHAMQDILDRLVKLKQEIKETTGLLTPPGGGFGGFGGGGGGGGGEPGFPSSKELMEAVPVEEPSTNFPADPLNAALVASRQFPEPEADIEGRLALEQEYQARLLELRIAGAEQWSEMQQQLTFEQLDRAYQAEIDHAMTKGADTTALYAAWEQEKNQIAAEFMRARVALDQQEKQSKMQMQSQMLGALNGFVSAAFGSSKEAAIAHAIMNTYEGASKAIAQGGIYGAVLAAIVIATGMAQVAKIRSTSLKGGGAGGGGASGGASVPTIRTAIDTSYTGSAGYLPTGPSMGTPQEPGTGTAAARGGIPSGSTRAGGTFASLNVTINALDSADVERWISSRRNSSAVAERVLGEFIGR